MALAVFRLFNTALFRSARSIIPVAMMTGMKKMARNAARPGIFWFSTTAMNRLKIRMLGVLANRVDTDVARYWTNLVSDLIA